MTIPRSANASRLSQDWTPAAERAREALEAAPTGQKVAALEKVAAEFSIGRDLLRRAVTCLRMTEKMAARGIDVPAELHHVPLGVVDVIVRWALYDREAAWDALGRYRNGDLQFRALMRAEAAARPAGRGRRDARRIDVVRAWKEACLERVAAKLREAGLMFAADVDITVPVDALAHGGDARAPTVAVVIVGPYEDAAAYEKVMVAVLLRALGLAHLGHPTWVVVPGLKLGRRYEAWVAGYGVPPSEVRIVGLHKPPQLSDYT